MTRRNRKPSQRDDKVVTIGSDSWETLWAEVMPEKVPAGPPPGEGWKTAADIANERERSRQTTEQQLRAACARGTVERIKRRGGPNGTWVYFYRPTCAKTDFSRKVARATR